MRGFWFGVVTTVAVLLHSVGNAQSSRVPTPPSPVSAGGAEWQMNSEPLVVGGLTYYPTRGFRLFDGQVMVQTGTYEGVPVYSDPTLEPYMEIYVPLGSGRMRVYERRREGELAGTTGSHVSALLLETPSVSPRSDRQFATARAVELGDGVGTSGTIAPRAVSDSAFLPQRARSRRTAVITVVPHSGEVNTVWLDFNGARWFASGAAVSFSPDRFEPMGAYRGFPVYKDKIGGSDEIWVSVVKDGPLAPYRRQ